MYFCVGKTKFPVSHDLSAIILICCSSKISQCWKQCSLYFCGSHDILFFIVIWWI